MKLALLFAGTAAAVAKLRTQAFLGTDMQPEAVARTLVHVEDEWRAQAASFAECNETLTEGSDTSGCDTAPRAFQKSCATVVSAVVKASDGNKGNVKEYMGTVCGEAELRGWHQERCGELASSVFDFMSDDDYENRENFKAASLCTRYWSKFAAEEKVRVDQERADREAAEKKAEQERIEAEKKAEQERIEAEKKAEEERIEAEKKAAMEAAEAEKRRAKEEAARKVAEAQKQAEAAAAELKAKKEEAERQAQEAKNKMEAAQAAAEAVARHHREALANATEALKKFNVSATNLTHAPTNVLHDVTAWATTLNVVSNVTANTTK